MCDRPQRVCSRGHDDKPTDGVCPTCRRIADEEMQALDAQVPAGFALIDTACPCNDHGATFHPDSQERG
mgnify:CR=1 FL=1